MSKTRNHLPRKIREQLKGPKSVRRKAKPVPQYKRPPGGSLTDLNEK